MVLPDSLTNGKDLGDSNLIIFFLRDQNLGVILFIGQIDKVFGLCFKSCDF